MSPHAFGKVKAQMSRDIVRGLERGSQTEALVNIVEFVFVKRFGQSLILRKNAFCMKALDDILALDAQIGLCRRRDGHGYNQ